MYVLIGKIVDVDFIQDCDGPFLPWKLNVESVDKVILNHMKRGKAAGYDNLTLEHIVSSHPSLICHLCKLFNLMLKNCYVPNDFGRGIAIPLIKDKRGNVSDSAHYRGITISPVISNIFELCLMYPSWLGACWCRTVRTSHKLGCRPHIMSKVKRND